MKRFIGPLLLPLLFASAVFGTPGQSAPEAVSISPPEETYILLVNDAGMEWSRWTAGLEQAGIRPRFYFPPDAVLLAQEASRKGLPGRPLVPAALYEQIADAEVQALSVRSTPLRMAANALRFLQSPGVDHPIPPADAAGTQLMDDALTPPDLGAHDRFYSCDAQGLKRTGSEYLLKTVWVNVILPESNGAIDPQTETWAEYRETEVANEIVQGLNNLSAKYPLDGRLAPSWYIVWYIPRDTSLVQTSYEPITRPSTDEGLWIKEIMANFGYSTTLSVNDMVREFNGDARNNFRTTWAFTIFVADSFWDVDGKFTDGFCAYAWLGGPYLVMTYDNDGWGITFSDRVTTHETGHIFNALDEYAESACTCGAKSGYFSWENHNCMNACTYDWECTMRSNLILWTGNVCLYSRGHIGWGDLDGDSIPDPVDIDPETTLTPYAPDPSGSVAVTYAGNAHVQARTNQNNIHHWYACDINILNISSVQYRIDGGAWQSAAAADGAFNSGSENFTFTATLSSGTHTVEARAVDELGQTDPTPASDTVTVAGPGEPTDFKVVKSGTNLILDWTVPGPGCTPTGYAVYSGAIGAPDSHNQSRTCSITAPPSVAPSWVFPDNSYILVTAFNEAVEGSYGRTYPDNVERTASAARCRPAQFVQSCP